LIEAGTKAVVGSLDRDATATMRTITAIGISHLAGDVRADPDGSFLDGVGGGGAGGGSAGRTGEAGAAPTAVTVAGAAVGPG
jgi:hypothetical protein